MYGVHDSVFLAMNTYYMRNNVVGYKSEYIFLFSIGVIATLFHIKLILYLLNKSLIIKNCI